MTSRAVWKTIPDDPTSLLGWARSVSRPRVFGTCLRIIFAAAIVGFAVAWSPWILFASTYVLWPQVRRSRKLDDLTPLMTLPAPGPAFECRAIIERGPENVVVGFDDGIVTFIDGWLHFAGLHTEFSLNPRDVRGSGGTPTPRLLLIDVTVELSALNLYDQQRLNKASQIWYSSVAEGDGSILPPRCVHPTGLARAWLRAIE